MRESVKPDEFLVATSMLSALAAACLNAYARWTGLAVLDRQTGPYIAVTMSDITIWYNPRCSKCRQTLELIRGGGAEPTIVEYLEAPPTVQELEEALTALGFEPRELMRTKEPLYRELSLDDASLSRTQLLRAMSENPILIERPVVFRGKRAVLARPPENVVELLGS